MIIDPLAARLSHLGLSWRIESAFRGASSGPSLQVFIRRKFQSVFFPVGWIAAQIPRFPVSRHGYLIHDFFFLLVDSPDLAVFVRDAVEDQITNAEPRSLHRIHYRPLFFSKASAARNFRSKCGPERNVPVLSTQRFLRGTPQVGHTTESTFLRERALVFISILHKTIGFFVSCPHCSQAAIHARGNVLSLNGLKIYDSRLCNTEQILRLISSLPNGR